MPVKLKILLPIVLLMLIEIIIITKVSTSLNNESLDKHTVTNGIQTITQYQEIRAYYNENIVSKVSQYPQFKIDPDHKDNPNTIPLPATMIHDLSKRLSQKIDGMQLKLYSDYPFANRANNVLDTFEQSAIEDFRQNKKHEPIIKREQNDGGEVIRVAVADVMNSMSCVNCHNTRVDTPKADWKLGDVRGVLEVIIPVEKQVLNATSITNAINTTILITGIILILFIYFIISHYTNLEQRQRKELEEKQYNLNKSLISFGDNVIASNTDLYGNITYASQALCHISGYTQEELVSQSHNILRHPDMPKELYAEMWHTIKNEQTWIGEIKNRKKNGGFYWVQTTVFPDYDFNKNLIGYSSIRHDITAQKAKEEFFSNMSHELRTPLNAIVGFVNILQKELSNLTHQNYLEYIGSSAQQLLKLINDILDLSKIHHGDFTIDEHEFHAYDNFVKYIPRFDGTLSGKNITFEHHISQNLQGVFLGDWLRISQIIMNLISNAIKFTPKGGTITLNADYKDDNLILTVIDTGIGMHPDVQDKIFKPFVQADGSTTRKYGGTGLGLSITQKLIEMMMGSLKLQSEENKGSTFSITIPMQKLSDDLHVQESSCEITLHSPLTGKVLVAEDNMLNQTLIKLYLEKFGLECDIAEDGQEALDMYDPCLHQLILMDENMPNMNGTISMHRIREKHQNKCGPIIAVTANVMKGDKERFLAEGMDAYLAKPLDENELYEVLAKFLPVQ